MKGIPGLALLTLPAVAVSTSLVLAQPVALPGTDARLMNPSARTTSDDMKNAHAARRKQLLARARANDVAAMRELAQAYASGELGLKKSLAKAAHWYRRAAQAGDVQAQHALAMLLLKGGQGVKRAPRIAAALLLAAAKKGHVPSQYALAHMLERGIGMTRDVKEARKWFEKAAEKGHAPAQVALGVMALTGRGGQTDFEAAREWFAKAAEQQDGWALNNLGAMYEMGWGVQKDREKAVIYYELAHERGNPAATRNLVRLGELPPETLAAASAQQDAETTDALLNAEDQTAAEQPKKPRIIRRYNFRAGR